MYRLDPDRFWLIWAAVAPIAVWAAIRVFGFEQGYPLVPLMAYTPYVALAALLVAGTALALRNWAASIVAALAAICLVAAVLPRALGGEEDLPAGGAELRVLSTNVHVGDADPEAVIGLVERHDADVLIVQELTPRFARALQREGILRLLPETHISLDPVDFEARPKASGGGLYSRLPMRALPAPLTSAFRQPRAMVRVAPGEWVRFVDVHPYPPRRCCIGLWRSALESLPLPEPAAPPWVLAGDFNATLDFAEMREILGNGYRDAAEVTGNGLEPTWPDGRRLPPPVTIDHVLAESRLAILEYAVEDVPGSDHHAVFTSIGVPAG